MIPSLDCGLEPKVFVEEHMVRSEMVKVLGCEKAWPARDWTIRSLLERDRAGWRWRTNFVDHTGRAGLYHTSVFNIKFWLNNFLLKTYFWCF